MIRSSILLSLVVLASLLLNEAPGVEAPMLAQATRGELVRFRIVSGRIDVVGVKPRHSSSRSSSSGGTRRESLSVAQNGLDVKVDYDRTTDKEELSVAIETGGKVSISYGGQGKSDRVPIRFEQKPGHAVVLTVGADDQQRRIEAAGLWHLLMAEPEVCRKHLLPVLKLLRADWKFEETAMALEKELLEIAARDGPSRRARWVELVEQLADDRFGKREAADRALRADGGAVLGFLSRLDFKRLDAEQQFRIRRIIRSLTPTDGDDQPGTVAPQLVGDPMVWLGLLNRDRERTRQIAADQLAEILGKPIRFDPAAEPSIRAAQISRLRQVIAGR